MDLLIDKILEFKSLEPSSLMQSVLLLLIWLNVRSLKKILTALQENHEVRITTLEIKTGIRDRLEPVKP